MNGQQAFELLCRTLVDGALCQRLSRDLPATLSEEGVADPQQAQQLAALINLIMAGANANNALATKFERQLDGTLAVATEMKNGLKSTLEQIDSAFRSTMLMYQICFYLGVLLVVVAVVVALLGQGNLLAATFGSLGVLDVLLFFLAKPQEKLQSSRANLAQLQAALYNWFMDSVNQNTLLSLLHQRGASVEEMQKVLDSLMRHTDRTLEMMQKYCKLV